MHVCLGVPIKMKLCMHECTRIGTTPPVGSRWSNASKNGHGSDFDEVLYALDAGSVSDFDGPTAGLGQMALSC